MFPFNYYTFGGRTYNSVLKRVGNEVLDRTLRFGISQTVKNPVGFENNQYQFNNTPSRFVGLRAKLSRRAKDDPATLGNNRVINLS